MISNSDNFTVSGASTEVGFALTDGTGSGPGPGSGIGSGPGSGCPSGKLIKYPLHRTTDMSICDLFLFPCAILRTLDLKAVAKFIKRLFAGGFSIPRPSQNREAVLPIINDSALLASFYRNYRQRKNNPEVDSPMRVPRSIYNEAIPVQVPCVKDWKLMGGRDSITLNIDIALFKRSLKSVFVAVPDFQITSRLIARPFPLRL